MRIIFVCKLLKELEYQKDIQKDTNEIYKDARHRK